jgi:hypothetical protein
MSVSTLSPNLWTFPPMILGDEGAFDNNFNDSAVEVVSAIG